MRRACRRGDASRAWRSVGDVMVVKIIGDRTDEHGRLFPLYIHDVSQFVLHLHGYDNQDRYENGSWI